MSKIFFEEKGAALLEKLGMSKAEFARRMGIQRQNVNTLFSTKNLETIYKAAMVLGVPFELLIGYTSEPVFVLEDTPCTEVFPCEIGPFGKVYNGFEGKPKEAFWFLINHQEGDLLNVFSRKETGPIDLVWGDEGCGVRHILVKHINEKDFPTVNQMIDSVSDVIQRGDITFEDTDKAVFRKGAYLAVIRKNYRIDGKKPESKNWVLTAYSKNI